MADDYPRTLMELERRFATEEACAAYLAGLRWPQGFCCPACGGADAWRTNRGLWFRAIWLVVTQKDGASALGLQRVLGLGSYRTAWSLLHKLRRAMVRPD